MANANHATPLADGQGAGLLQVGRTDLTKPIITIAVLAASLVILVLFGGEQVFPESITRRFAFVDWVNQAEEWLQANFRWLTRGISDGILLLLEPLEEFLWFAPWPVVVLSFALPALAYGGLRLMLLTIFCIVLWAGFGMWDDAMTTLAMMIVAVSICVLTGIATGVLCARSDTVEALVRPILDTMQVMPAFVYLLPAIFFFGTNAAAATIAVMIYAFPPVVRLTNLGIRQVPPTMMEAATSYGATRWQLLTKVQVPQAMPSILLGINQTIMMALALAVFSTFVGAGGGLGDQVWKAITKLKVGWSLEGGLCIVTMAIVFDRLSQAMSKPPETIKLAPGEMLFRLLPQSWEKFAPCRWVESGIDLIWQGTAAPGRALAAAGGEWVARHIHLVMGACILSAIYLIDAWFWSVGSYPRAWEFSIREPVDAAIDWLTVNPAFIVVTKTMKAWMYLYFLNPLDHFLTHLPWWYVAALFTGGVWMAAGWRLALAVLVSLMFCGAAGLWDLTLYTFAGTVVSVVFCLLFGIPLGIWAANSKIVDGVLRPILDLMQTIPTFVYLIPALFFFGGSPTTAIFATVIYAIPPIIRTTALGLKQVPADIEEVTRSFGSTRLQALWKAKLPLASPSIMLGINQTIIMALAMQTVTPLVAGLGLGKEVYDAMNTADTGKGLAAGIGIALMAIMLDRLSHAMTANQRRALGLS
ncbi:MAG: ABC transporter permease subunit [Pseudomonadota bacterium]